MESTPVSWFLLQKEMKNSGKVELTMAEVEKMLREVQQTTPEVEKISRELHKTSTLDVKKEEMETIKHLSELLSEPGVKKIQWVESTVTDITHDQKESKKQKHSELINEERSDFEESEVESKSEKEDDDIANMTSDQPDNYEKEMKEHKPIKQVTEAESIVEFYASIGDVLHFPKFADLKNKIIVKPMEPIGDCR